MFFDYLGEFKEIQIIYSEKEKEKLGSIDCSSKLSDWVNGNNNKKPLWEVNGRSKRTKKKTPPN